MITKLPLLKTQRLLLRPIEHKDAPEILFLRSDPIVNAYVKRPQTESLEDAVVFIDKIIKGVADRNWLFWGISLPTNPTLIGTICLWNFSKDHKTAEVGYDLHKDYHRQGIMNEALDKILKFGFNELKFEQIEAYTHKNNEASKKLLQQNGFIYIPDRFDHDNVNNIILVLRKS